MLVASYALFANVRDAQADTYIHIAKIDTRTITDLQVGIAFDISFLGHFSDWQTIGDWTSNATLLDLDGRKATSFNGSAWVGDFLSFNSSFPRVPEIVITNLDPRSLTNVRLSVSFKIGGQLHVDYEDTVFGFAIQGKYQTDLVIDGSGGTWDGTEWVGNFLRRRRPEE
jgi:hypothetical protein